MEYRSDIDGLRAVAVLSVVLYHAGFSSRLSGGFVGVDVFFVISGYLITGILQRDVEHGRLSIGEFYNRRVRRIFPALFAVHLFCLVASAVLLFPSEARDVGKDVLWSLAFLSNVAFRASTGYFDQTAKTAPLLHTWSLSVEEQFYVVLPLLLFALGRVTHRARVGVLAALAVASFSAAVWMVRLDASRAFYLMQYRAWELLVGSLLALGVVPRVRKRALAEALGVGGVGLIVLGIVAIRGSTPFPGVWALPPCLGALLILHSGSDVRTATAQLLGSPPLRFVGTVSYSFYLWHWPLIALWNSRSGAMSQRQGAAIAAVSFVAAVLSHRWVELPFRRKPYRRGTWGALRVAALGMAAVASLAVGVPIAAARLRPPAQVGAVMAYLKHPGAGAAMRIGTCFLTEAYNDPSLFRKDICLGVRRDRRNFLLVGDSHAAHLWPGLQAVRSDINFLQATASGCPALRGSQGAKRCTGVLAFVFDTFLPAHHLDAILLSGRWVSTNLAELQKTVAYLRPFADRVVVLGPIVEYDQPLPRLLARSILDRDPGLPARHRVTKQRAIDRILTEGLRASGAEYFSLYAALCPGGECTVWASTGVPLQFDYGHLTERGAELALERLGPGLFR
jgi:peptidoglycan/LPS O-acetylase OafA/YrhL